MDRRHESQAEELRSALITRVDLSQTSCKQICRLMEPLKTSLPFPQLSSFYYHQLVDSEKLKANRLHASEKAKSLLKLSREPQNYKPLIILLFMFLFQQLSGCYILIFYTINVLRNLSLHFTERINENMALMLLGGLRLIMSVIASGYEPLFNEKTFLKLMCEFEGEGFNSLKFSSTKTKSFPQMPSKDVALHFRIGNDDIHFNSCDIGASNGHFFFGTKFPSLKGREPNCCY